MNETTADTAARTRYFVPPEDQARINDFIADWKAKERRQWDDETMARVAAYQLGCRVTATSVGKAREAWDKANNPPHGEGLAPTKKYPSLGDHLTLDAALGEPKVVLKVETIMALRVELNHALAQWTDFHR